MKIVADANLFGVQNEFARYGELLLVPGREIRRSHIEDADALLIRSITPVTAELIENTRVKFVGTATSGTDHIDIDFLAGHDIAFAAAKGSNANAVVDYCFTALAYCILHKGLDLNQVKVGIVGGGNTGGLFAQKLMDLGLEVLINDPPLAELEATRSGTAKPDYCSLNDVARCQVVSLHVPLTHSGRHRTRHLIDESFLKNLPENAILINSCRGSVVNEAALLQVLRRRPDLCCIVDVWENEPVVNARLVDLVDIATPHIAGYSAEAKLAAAIALRKAFLEFFDLPQPNKGELTGNETVSLKRVTDDKASCWATLLAAFPLQRLSGEFKAAVLAGNSQSAFDALRKQLMTRREFRSMQLAASAYTDEQRESLSIVGFSFV